jgi:cation-dependent mannose-6-phosphate receptor
MLFQRSLLSILPLLSSVLAASDSDKKDPPPKPCTIRSSSTGNFFDLNELHILPPKKDDKESRDPNEKTKPPESFHVKGYDYGSNFTLNICGPVVEDLDDVSGVSSSLRKNVSAYYTKGRETYSIG